MEIIKHMAGGITLAAKALDGTLRAIGRSIDHIRRAIARSADHIGRTIAHSVDHTWRPIFKNADKGARELLKNADHGAREFFKNVDKAGRAIGRGIDGEVREILSGGKYSRNSNARGWSLEHSDLVKWVEGWDAILIIGGAVMVIIGILTGNPALIVWGIMTITAGITGGDYSPEGSGGSEGA
ncbi:hypothetical protein [Leptospira kmetyi]|uniref:hypothetical protein n=1 Tax=Leptospira kmetyi TaxID=408139 RepID=UPI001A9CAFEE|nr:hypothetical protein [Leptospira kmetyi]